MGGGGGGGWHGRSGDNNLTDIGTVMHLPRYVEYSIIKGTPSSCLQTGTAGQRYLP